MTRSLDLGCGHEPINPFSADEVFGVDLQGNLKSGIRGADLVIEPIPFESDYFDFVTACNFLEHIPRLIYAPTRRYPFVELMNEIYRVLKMGGNFLSATPAFPNPVAFRDPTHVNYLTEETLPAYFGIGYFWGRDYGFTGAFELTCQYWDKYQLVTRLQKVAVP